MYTYETAVRGGERLDFGQNEDNEVPQMMKDLHLEFLKQTRGPQGWIQTSATSFQKLVRIVKKFKKTLRKPC